MWTPKADQVQAGPLYGICLSLEVKAGGWGTSAGRRPRCGTDGGRASFRGRRS
jgi:hypothetical protein